MARLTGKRAIITGAASGIGRASALRFAEEGAELYLVDQNEEGIAETAFMIADIGGEAHARAADVSAEEEVEEFSDDAAEKMGGIDVLFANAGIGGAGAPFFAQTADHWRRVFGVNVFGTFLCIRYAGPHIIEQGAGSIICTASVAGIRANAADAPYNASKAGVMSLVQSTACELSGTGVRANGICPGLIETGMTAPIFEGARERGTEHRIGQLNPSGRAGQPVEIANMAVFLASDESSYLNGQAIPVDGGLTASHPWVFPRS